MFAFLRSLRRPAKPFRILILGLDNSGKTSLLHNLSLTPTETVRPTQGFNVKTVTHNNIQYTVWDIGGQESIRAYWRNYFECSDLVIYVIDSSDPKRFAETSVELARLLGESKLEKVPLLVFANKQDIATAVSGYEIADGLSLNSIRDRAWHIQPCSMKLGTGVEEGLRWMATQLTK